MLLRKLILACLLLGVAVESRGGDLSPRDQVRAAQLKQWFSEMRSRGMPYWKWRSIPPDYRFRRIDGSGNNLLFRGMNAADTPLKRMAAANYSDGLATMTWPGRPGPREISNAVVAQNAHRPNAAGASDFLWQWGQFLDHDIDLTEAGHPAEPAAIPVPAGDPFFDPTYTGTAVIAFSRSIYDPASGASPWYPRRQMNQITGWIDGSNVYGSSEERAEALRAFDGSGRLATSPGDLLPFNTYGLPNAGGAGADLFLAGDVRANEQVGLTAMHTLFVREHNRLATVIAARHPYLDGEQVYQHARRFVAAEMQVITYREFIPALLGPNALTRYRGYRGWTDARLMNEFSTAAFRLGHSLLSPVLLRLDATGAAHPSGDLPLREAFFAPDLIAGDGIEPLLRGLAAQVCQELDVYVVDDIRNFLFGMPGQGGFDLAALNIQRGRDHGLPTYNDARRAMGLAAAATFADVTADVDVQRRLASVYASADEIDLWVGGLAEDHVPGALVGELFFSILKAQFEALRDGDRFWYQRSLSPAEQQYVENTTLAGVIRRNTSIGNEMADDVFHVR